MFMLGEIFGSGASNVALYAAGSGTVGPVILQNLGYISPKTTALVAGISLTAYVLYCVATHLYNGHDVPYVDMETLGESYRPLKE